MFHSFKKNQKSKNLENGLKKIQEIQDKEGLIINSNIQKEQTTAGTSYCELNIFHWILDIF
jgi:hypothetical protein